MGKQPIKEALGLGERLPLGGAYVECAPARLADLEDALELFSKSIGRGLSIQGCYAPGNTEAREAFEELLYLACGKQFNKQELIEKITIADGGKEVIAFIDRFLGFEPGGTGAAKEVGGQG